MTTQVWGRARTPFDALPSLDRLRRGESYTLRVQVADDRSRYDGASKKVFRLERLSALQ